MGSSIDTTTTGSIRNSPSSCAKEIDLSLGSQAVNTVIFAAALMVGMSFVRKLLSGMKKTLTMMMILMASFNFLREVFQIDLPSFG